MKTNHISEGNVCQTSLRSFLGKPSNCLVTRNAVVLAHPCLGKVFSALPCVQRSLIQEWHQWLRGLPVVLKVICIGQGAEGSFWNQSYFLY